MKRGYARVSTTGQDLQSQIERLKKEGCEIIYSEKFTGTNAQRTEFQRLLGDLEDGDILVVTKLDRFARSTRDALDTIEDLFNRGVRTHVLNMGIIENTPTGRLIFTIMSAFADFERDLIVERTQEGKAIARQKEGFREGRPNKYSKSQMKHALKLLENHFYKQVVEMTGISKSTLIRHKRKVSLNEF